MEIVVLLKQVPATESFISIAENGTTINSEDLKWVINPYDELAVEEALKIRQASGGKVTVVSLGPEKTVEAIRTALAMGADTGIRIDTGDLTPDGLNTARILAGALKDISHDLIICGHRAVDDDNFQVGPAVAEFLNLPHISMVVREEIEGNTIRCVTTVEGGTVELEAPLPALITTQRGLNEPRYASLPGIMKAKKKKIDTRTLEDIGIDMDALTPKINIAALQVPEDRKGGKIIEGETIEAKVAELVRLLRDETKVL
ncbi:MAG: electron transfer flavoprotein subunit beta/FixA family protein [Desulfobacteraceae bacterium]